MVVGTDLSSLKPCVCIHVQLEAVLLIESLLTQETFQAQLHGRSWKTAMNLLLATIQIILAFDRQIAHAAWEVWLMVDNGESPKTLVVS